MITTLNPRTTSTVNQHMLYEYSDLCKCKLPKQANSIYGCGLLFFTTIINLGRLE